MTSAAKWTEPNVIIAGVALIAGLFGSWFALAGSVSDIPKLKTDLEDVREVNAKQNEAIGRMVLAIENITKQQDQSREDYKIDQAYLRQTLDRLEQKIDQK